MTLNELYKQAYYKNKQGMIMLGDCLNIMRQMDDGCIDLTVTSPPYDNLRKYNGYCFDFKNIAKELYRITTDGGVVVWVVGDAPIKGSETGTSFRKTIYFMDCGFNLHDTMIYKKKNPIPQNHNRYEQCFEYMFVLSKGKPSTFNPIKEPTKNFGKSFQWGNRKTIMDDSQCRRDRGDDVRDVSKDKFKQNIWEYSVGGGKTGHPAVFPEQLATDHILSWSNPGDVVFDPFMGSGTTAKMAMLNNRKFVGCEVSEKYCEIIKERLDSVMIEKDR